MIFTVRLKGGKGSGHIGHTGRPGQVGGSLPGVGTITLSRNTTDAELANMVDDFLDARELGVSYPAKLALSETGEIRKVHIIQHSVRGRVTISHEEMKYGEPYQVFMSMSLRGKNRGKMRFDSHDSHRLLETQGWSKASGYLVR